MAEPTVQTVNLATLPLHELKHLADQLQQEVEVLSGSMQQLKTAQTQFQGSKVCLETLRTSKPGKEILVPLSSSLYVPGNLNDTENVLVDIGTGYHVEKKVEDAEDFFSRKIDFLKQQMESLQGVLQQKFQTKQMVAEVLQTKYMKQSQQQSR